MISPVVEGWKQEVLNLARNYVDEHVVFRGTFVNYTPWWGGNFNAVTLNLSSNKEAYVTSPDPKSIVGKTVWFMRTAFGDYFLNNLGITKGKEKRKSKIAVVVRSPTLVVNMDDGLDKNGNKVLYFGLKYKDDLISLLNKVNEKIGNKISSEEERKRRMFDQLCREGGAQASEYEMLKDFLTVLCIPRVLLRVGGKLMGWYFKDQSSNGLAQILALLPVRPQTVRFELEVRAAGVEERLVKDFVESLIFTLNYLGIGSGANRGFGRFMLEGKPYVPSKINVEYNAEELYRRWSKPPQPKRNDSFPVIRGIVELGSLKGGVEEALKCIGDSTLKVNWMIIMGPPSRLSERDLQTWVLGLPRIGYVFLTKNNKRIQRRQSYIVFSLTPQNQGEYKLFAIKFVPVKLGSELGVIEKAYYVGNRASKIDISPQNVEKYIEEAMDNVQKYITQVCKSRSLTAPQGTRTGEGR
ncbi:hypothetical protein [Acidilobus sp.]|uniref:hypothetical protein n=1 Tax=Acidilobus sp. TaxID=1872109 RepID=UPI003CFD0D95